MPLPRFPARPECRKELAHELRDLRWNPQRHLADGDGTAAELARQKQALAARQPENRHERRKRFRRLRDLTARLQPYVAEREEQVGQDLVRCAQQVEANEVVQRRDYAFCLYPEKELREFCTRFL